MDEPPHAWEQLHHEIQVDLSSGEVEASAQWKPGEDHRELTLNVEGEGKVRDLRVQLSKYPAIEEIFLTGPNANDVEFAHPSQILYHGLVAEHPDAIFGRQWMFSPPPMVFPVRCGKGWYGFALAAPMGKNLFSGWSYHPTPADRVARAQQPPQPTPASFDLVLHYDGHELEDGHAASLFFLTEAKATPLEVVAWYANLLRAKGWAPSPKRTAPDWWRDTFLCTWGEQCNYAAAKGQPVPGGDPVTMYETQANQLSWHQAVAAKGVPVGVACMSDKWQRVRERLEPDLGKYQDLRGFADYFHQRGRHVLCWFGLWFQDQAPVDWCLRDANGTRLTLDPESPGYAQQLVEDVRQLISPDGYDLDGFFLDFTSEAPFREGIQHHGPRWGVELLRHYVQLIHDAAKEVKPDAMLMTHCCHPLFADLTDVLRLNDYAFLRPDVVEQAQHRAGIAAATSDWLINTDNWFMYSREEWRRYLDVQPKLGIPASWYALGVYGDGTKTYEAFTPDDVARWAELWHQYRQEQGLPDLPDFD